MPHKHKRDKKGDQDKFELPPSSVAAPLPSGKSSTQKKSPAQPQSGNTQKRNSKRKRARNDDDDTPRAFARLMAWKQGIKPRSGLDDGAPKPKKSKRKEEEKSEEPAPEVKAPTADLPKILPGERMADYSARVDQALPLGGLVNKGKDLPGVKRQQTKTERKLQKMHKEWREIDARYKEKLLEAQEEAEEEEDPYQAILDARKSKKKKKGNAADSDDDDPWAALAKSRKEQAAKGGLVGVHDVVQAPPQLKAPKEKFKVHNGAKVEVSDVPGAAGSLRRREELGETRRSIVEGYRQMMKDRRGF